jgi:hypothetical protein
MLLHIKNCDAALMTLCRKLATVKEHLMSNTGARGEL